MDQLVNAPPGLFWFGDTESVSSPGIWQSDAYIVESGEYFWGGVSNPELRERLFVDPIDPDEAWRLLRKSKLEIY